ncbi:MAG: hypothetical protein AAFV93_20225 [Chloroflexota bacterium]
MSNLPGFAGCIPLANGQEDIYRYVIEAGGFAESIYKTDCLLGVTPEVEPINGYVAQVDTSCETENNEFMFWVHNPGPSDLDWTV